MKCPHCNGTGELQLGSMAMGDKLRYLREQAGLSLRDVENRVGISNAAVSQIETGKIKDPRYSIVMRLCEVYGIEPKELQESPK